MYHVFNDLSFVVIVCVVVEKQNKVSKLTTMSYNRVVIYLSLVRFCMELALQLVQTIVFISNLTLFYLFVHVACGKLQRLCKGSMEWHYNEC